MKSGNKELRKIFLDELKKMELENPDIDWRDVTLWTIGMRLFGKYADIHILTLKADMPVLKKIAGGQSTQSIANVLSISSKAVLKTAKLWDMHPLENTLDFNPLILYHKDMKPAEMMAHINEILPTPIDYYTAETIINNILRYYDLRDYLLEEELKEEHDARKRTA